MVHRRELTTLIGLFAIAALIACKKPKKVIDTPDAAPVDHLAKDEIPEGPDSAFTLVLPKGTVVIYRVERAVEVETELTPERLSNYVRKHVQTTKITAGAGATTFDDAIVPSDAATHLHIDVRPPPNSSRMRSSMYIRDVTPLPPAPKTTDEDAYKQIGRKPDGTPLDPKHMF